MYICVQCKTEMVCDKNGVGVRYNNGSHVFYGDRWKCPSCGNMIVKTSNHPVHEFEFNLLPDDIMMDAS